MARKTGTTQPSMPQNMSPMDEGKRVVLDRALGDIIKRYGEGAIMRLGEAHHMTIEAIPTRLRKRIEKPTELTLKTAPARSAP